MGDPFGENRRGMIMLEGKEHRYHLHSEKLEDYFLVFAIDTPE